jgi:NAD(P)-dependent dehydrogenase (short-subunit alcohol dehydrogenase family)
VLCSKGYDVTIACRDPTRAANALASLKAADPSASISYVLLDLANLQSVRDAAARWLDSGKQIDVLLNNAGEVRVGGGNRVLGMGGEAAKRKDSSLCGRQQHVG